MLCYFHFAIKTRATCRPKSRCQSDLSTVSVLANKNLHQDLMHSGCRTWNGGLKCLCTGLFAFPSPHQRPVQRLFKIEGFVCKRFLPSTPSPPLSCFGSCFISRAVKTENPVPRSFFAPKPNGNACYAGYERPESFTWRSAEVMRVPHIQ